MNPGSNETVLSQLCGFLFRHLLVPSSTPANAFFIVFEWKIEHFNGCRSFIRFVFLKGDCGGDIAATVIIVIIFCDHFLVH